MPHNRIPSPAIVLTFLLGIFFLVAAIGSWHPGIVKDRYNEQFLPLNAHFFGEGTAATALFARVSQIVIGIVELVGGLLLLWSVFDRRNRLFAAKAGYSLMMALFATFMITLFYLHDYALPNWHQFPAILAMLLLAWVVVEREHSRT